MSWFVKNKYCEQGSTDISCQSEMECPVCYENYTNCTLVCGHAFCKSCVKTWYMKGGTCPMCRKNVHYRRMPVAKWLKDAEESKKEEVYQEAFDLTLDDIMAPIELWEGTVIYRKNIPMHQLEYVERTYRAIKEDASAEDIDYVLCETLDYYSDRRVHLNKRTYSEFGHWYPHQKHRGGNRNKIFNRKY